MKDIELIDHILQRIAQAGDTEIEIEARDLERICKLALEHVKKLPNLNTDVDYFRPITWEQITNNIKDGVPFEIESENRKFICMCLDGFLKMKSKYTVRPSENEGWDVYESI